MAYKPWAGGANPFGLTELEVATGELLGDTYGASPPLPPPLGSPLAAIEDEARAALARPPCVVAFSGGRDSSALLAVFVRVARQEGLPDPVAVTARWPGDALSQENDWQEYVVGELGVKDWEIVTPGDQVDLLGPLASSVLGRHGLVWPPPLHTLLPLVGRATGGVLVTGEGGDEVFGSWPHSRAQAVLYRRRPLCLADARPLAARLAPAGLRSRVERRLRPAYQRWLRPEAYAAFARSEARDVASAPTRWDRYLRWVGGRRRLRLWHDSLSLVGRDHDVALCVPFLAAPFLAAMARKGGAVGLGNRSSAMAAVFGDAIPARLLTRTTKALFGDVLWGPTTKCFVEDWNGTGVAGEIVDAEALRAVWRQAPPPYGSALALQAAWLASPSFR